MRPGGLDGAELVPRGVVDGVGGGPQEILILGVFLDPLGLEGFPLADFSALLADELGEVGDPEPIDGLPHGLEDPGLVRAFGDDALGFRSKERVFAFDRLVRDHLP